MTSICNRIMSVDDNDENMFEFFIRKNQPRYFSNQFDHINKWKDIDFLKVFG